MRKDSIKLKVFNYNKKIEGYLGIRETAEMFGVNQITIRRHIHSGKLKAFRVGRLIKMSPESLEAYIKNNNVDIYVQVENNK